VALAHHWNRTGNVRVNAFSNCPKVDLKINGASQGQKTPNPWQGVGTVAIDQNSTSLPMQANWDVTWAAGTLRAECLDAAGKVVASDEKVTAGTAAKIVLTVEPPLVKPTTGEILRVKANGSDAAFVLATVVDDKGVWVPTANNPITFAVAGPANYRGGTDQYVTAGKPLTYHAPGDPELSAEGGMCKVAIRSKFQAGDVTVTATSPGLAPGEAKFTVYPVAP
jgi:beta-galactosidase